MDRDDGAAEGESEAASPGKDDAEESAFEGDILQPEEEDVIIADNTHEVVMEKFEQYRAECAMLDRKKHKDVEKVPKDDEDEAEKKKKLPPKLVLCTTQTKYRVIKKACRKLDFKLNDDENADWDLYWADTGI